ncbi:MAG: helix-turn-helix transcriptional regulator [Candidatus Nealsonbacteria bacterium]|nr:helix-turn-helix transcriptional regulator [Candidatus Nealsonbacteria bacterium]
MIQNDWQKNVTKTQIATLNEALEAAVHEQGDMDPRLYGAMVAGIRSQIDDLEKEVQEYDALETALVLHMESRLDIGRVLIQGRVARGLTQKELAERLNLKPQQIQKYEATQYEAASLKRVQDILAALELDFEVDIPLRKGDRKQRHPQIRRSGRQPASSSIPNAQRMRQSRFVLDPVLLYESTGIDLEYTAQESTELDALLVSGGTK